MRKKNWDKAIPEKEVFDELFRVSKNQIIFGGNYFTRFLPPTKSWVVWDKIGGLKCRNSFSDCELIWTSFGRETRKIEVVQQGFIREDRSERIHPTQKPLTLFKKLVLDYSKEDDLIADFFSGSGTTAVACWELKRNFICVEKDFDYWKTSVERLKEYQRQGVLF